MIRVVGSRTRAAIIRSQRITGLAPDVIAELVAEIGPLWHERHQAVLTSRLRRRAVGAGAKYKLAFVDRLLATLVHLRHATTHDVLACWFGVDRSTITRAIGEVRLLLAERGCTVAPDIRLRTLAEVSYRARSQRPSCRTTKRITGGAVTMSLDSLDLAEQRHRHPVHPVERRTRHHFSFTVTVTVTTLNGQTVVTLMGLVASYSSTEVSLPSEKCS
ncbi:transposase family protein [Streptomyces griseus]|uniref:transposase family protein n=1 Tax=Streptomyces griseus TaxID=1911 RepID=UPI0037D17EAD